MAKNYDVELTMQGDGKFYDEHGGEWEMTQETYERRTANCMCRNCIERRRIKADNPNDTNEAFVTLKVVQEAIAGVLENSGLNIDKWWDDLVKAQQKIGGTLNSFNVRR